jgi:predicted transcriptional regulator
MLPLSLSLYLISMHVYCLTPNCCVFASSSTTAIMFFFRSFVRPIVLKVGILTKTDLLKAYTFDIKLNHPVKEIMSVGLLTCDVNMNRDEVAMILEQNKNHHAIVIDPETKLFQGLISTWDITVECAKDDRAVSSYY